MFLIDKGSGVANALVGVAEAYGKLCCKHLGSQPRCPTDSSIVIVADCLVVA